MYTPTNILLVITGTTTALMAGLFYSWSCSVTIGLAHLPDKEYISAMQSMNRAIQNPAFFVCFLGTVILLPLSTYIKYGDGTRTSFWCLLCATILYVTGVFGVTIFGNVPLNEALDAFQLQTASPKETILQRVNFEVPWNRLNMIRTVFAASSVVFVILACLNSKTFERIKN